MRVTAMEPTFTLDGEEIAIPVEVRSARMVAAQFFVDASAAQRIVDPTGLQVARQPGGRTMCVLSAVDYADSDLGPYHEVALAFTVVPHDLAPGARPSWRSPSTYIHRLPVNQRFTCQVGRGLWGFPKWVCDISYVDRGDRIESVVVDDGELVLGLEVRHGLVPLPANEMAMTCYSLDDDGVLRRTPWTTRNRLTRARPGGATVEVGSRHPVADELRSLGLPRRAFMTTSTGIMSASFGAPEVVPR